MADGNDGPGTPLLRKAGDSTPPPALEWPWLRDVLADGKMKALFDWGPLITFYILEPPTLEFWQASLVATIFSAVSLSVTQLRSYLDATVVSPKVLDLGFFLIFLLLTVVASSSTEAETQMMLWANPMMDAGIAVIVGVGCYFDQPFTKQFLSEARIPREVLEDPNMMVVINQKLAEEAMIWCWGFWAMALVSTPAPAYVDLFGGSYGSSTYWTLTWTCTYGLQYAVLAVMLYRSLVYQPQQRQARMDWLTKPVEDRQAVYGPPTTVTVDATTGREIEGGAGGDGGGTRVVSSMQRRATEEEGDDTSIAYASRVLARAFEHDPIMLSWPGVGDQPTDVKLDLIQKYFAIVIRQNIDLNHVFQVDGCKAVAVVVPNYTGIEYDYIRSGESMMMHGWSTAGIPMPSPKLTQLVDQTEHHVKRMSRDGKFMHLALFGADPDYKGQGYGRCLLTRILDIADKKGLPVSLDTETDQNKLNYWYYGFDLVGEGIHGPPPCTEAWVSMVRMPNTPKRPKSMKPPWAR